MPKRSVRENKNIYQQAREAAGLTRAAASAESGFLSESVIEKIEYGEKKPDPEEVVALAQAYKRMDLCNLYCARECAIGARNVREISVRNLPDIVIGMLDSLNHLEQEKNRLIEITVDGQVSEDELKDFARIRQLTDRLSMMTDALRLWVEQNIAEGRVDGCLLRQYQDHDSDE
jgi:hypothetical protein